MKSRTLLANIIMAALVSLTLAAQNQSQSRAPGSPPSPTTVTQLSGNVSEFYYVVTTGPGQYDHIGIHRVTLVDKNGNPKPGQNPVLMVHGDFWPFDQAFSGGISRNSIADYLASQRIDVWGIDLAWTMVPATESDFTFMKNWGMQHDITDIETAFTFARNVRSHTGSDNGPMTLLAWSRGGWLGYGLLNQESQLSCNQRQAKAFVSVDNFYKTDSSASQSYFCSSEAYYNQQIANDIYAFSAQFIQSLGQDAVQSPNTSSLLFGDPYTNLTASLTAGAAWYQLGGIFTPYYHFVGGFWPDGDYDSGIPSGLTYTNIAQWNNFELGASPYEPVQLAADTTAITCGDDPKLPFDKHLSDIRVPVHYVGAGGGFGSYGLYTLSLLGSHDITNHIVSFYPPEKQALDFGHVDLFYADNAQRLVWSDILEFLQNQEHALDGRCKDN